VAFKAHGLFLCAEADGRITLCRRERRDWETLMLSNIKGVPKQDLPNARACTPLGDEDSKTKLVIVDVGAAGGLQQSWAGAEDRIVTVLFEPNPQKAEELRHLQANFCYKIVIESALGDRIGVNMLNLTREISCSSLLKPNHEFLGRYSITPAFDVMSSAIVNTDVLPFYILPEKPRCRTSSRSTFRALSLRRSKVSGRCRKSAWRCSSRPTCIQLFHKLTRLLGSFGLVLRRIAPIDHFDGDLVEVDAWYTVSSERAAALDEQDGRKLSRILKEWALPNQSRQFQ
jgi:hypothetical protein